MTVSVPAVAASPLEASLRALLRQAAAGVVHVDLDGRFLEVNAKWIEMFGYTAAELATMRVADLTHPEDLAESITAIAQLKAGLPGFALEKRYVAKDGHVVWCITNVTATRDGQGRANGMFAIAVDITARKAAEQQRRFYEMLLGSSLDFISVVDRDHRFVYVNERLAGHWGLQPADFIGRTLAEVGHTPEQVQQHTREFDQVLQTATPVRAEVQGGDRRYEYIMVPILGHDGRVEAVASVTRDVTENRRLSEQKDHFIAMLAHELRNPLAPLRTGLEIVRLSPQPLRALESLRPILERQVAHLVRLVDDLLDMSRIGLGKIELRRTRVLLANVVADAVETVRPAIDAAGLELQVALPDEPLYLDADLTRFAQVLGNLLHNAIKFTPSGGRVAIEARRDGPEVEIVVRDNGVGIPQDMLGRIFEQFAQADRRIDRDAGGLGMGLALVKGLVELHGGTVRAESPGPNRGSSFILRLPVLAG